MIKKISILLLSIFSYAEEVRCALPDKVLGGIIEEVRGSLRETCKRTNDIEEVRKAIRSTFMEHVDSSMIAKQVLGRKYWFDSDKEDKKKLQDLLEVLLIKQYSEAFNCQYIESKVDVYPVRGEIKRYSKVDSNVYFAGEDPIQVRYAVRCDDDKWKIFDIVVGGLSIAQTYRSQFNRMLTKGGIQQLNKYLEAKLMGKEDVVSSD